MSISESAAWRVLVVANETVTTRIVQEVIRLRAGEGGEVLVVAPALNSRLGYWSSDEDRARLAARGRLDSCLDALRTGGVDAQGHVGDADPLLAIQDALHVFRADEIVIATHPAHRSHWLTRDVVRRARSRFAQPVHHVVVEAGTHRLVAA